MRRPLRTPHVAALVTASLGISVAFGCGTPPQPAAPPPPPTSVLARTITGAVVGPDGAPIAGATVAVDTGFSGHNFVRVQTDANGRFALDIAVPALGPRRQLVFGNVCAYAAGYAVGGDTLRDGENVIHLGRPVELSGRIVDESGRPVADALVILSHVEQDRGHLIWLAGLRGEFTASSGRDGGWTIPGVPASEGIAYVRLIDPRFVCVQAEAHIGEGSIDEAVLVARPGGSIAGRVVRQDGAPAAGATVFADAQHTDDIEAVPVSRAQTVADGSYLLSSLGSGVYGVMVREPSGDWVADAHERVRITRAGTKRVPDLVITPGCLVEGRVVDWSTGDPVARLRVTGHKANGSHARPAIWGTHTDANGWYQLRLPPGETEVVVHGVQAGYADASRTLKLTVGQDAALDFEVRPPRKKGMTWWPF